MPGEVFADLHIHSTASDGTLTPEEVVDRAARLGLGAVSIADHDTVEGVPNALKEGCRVGLEVIPAVEINTDSSKGEAHILGYFLAQWEPSLEVALADLRESRRERLERMVERLQDAGVDVELSRVLEIGGHGSVGRPHLAHAIVEAGFARTPDEAFRRFLVRGAPGYVPRKRFAPAEAIELVHNAGGVAVIAHPEKVHDEALIDSLISGGLDGVEVYHVDHSPSRTRWWREFASKRGLLLAGGSDSHGPGAVVDVEIGCTGLTEEEFRAFMRGLLNLSKRRLPRYN
jgi:predicted metal-dependent phosphoesterase TrpH